MEKQQRSTIKGMISELSRIPLGSYPAEGINAEVKQHICSLNYKDWSLAEQVKRLYDVGDIFNYELFDGVLSTPIITISRLRITTLGCFIIGRNDFGARNHIKINSKHMSRENINLYRTLLHEMLHQSEYEIHKKKPNRGNYHSSFFQLVARNIGIPVNNKGISLGIIRNSPFTQVLLKMNLISEEEWYNNTVENISEREDMNIDTHSTPRSKLLKYSCSCTNVRAAVSDFRARCLKCGKEFQLTEKCAL
jgi:hypothetical protein